MFGNVRLVFGTILENLRKSSESSRKSSENRQKRRYRVCGILNIFVLLDKFIFLILNENLLLLKFLSRFFHLVAFIWEFKVLKVIGIFPRSSLDFCIFNFLRPRGLFV